MLKKYKRNLSYRIAKDCLLPYKKLAISIVEQAIRDYKNPYYRNEVERFFRSEWFEELFSAENGERIIKYLRNVKKRKNQNSKQ